MELRHLRYFVAVARELNFTRAAEKLHTSQPSLSSQIRDLETCVGVSLLIRDKRKVALTAAGECFLQFFIFHNDFLESVGLHFSMYKFGLNIIRYL